MEKMKSTAAKLDKLFRILHVCTAIAAIAALVGIAIILAAFVFHISPDAIGTGYSSIDIGFLTLNIAPQYTPDKQAMLLVVAAELVFAFVLALACRRFIDCLRRILSPMIQGEPFQAAASRNLTDLAKLSIVIGILVNAAVLTSQAMTVFALNLPELLISEKITHIQGSFTADFSFLVFSAVLFLLSYVFRYGEELQQLSDETL